VWHWHVRNARCSVSRLWSFGRAFLTRSRRTAAGRSKWVTGNTGDLPQLSRFMSRIEDLERFYESIDRLRIGVRGARFLRDCSKTTGWPTHGVYFFFEDGEQREVGGPRIVRVGTHAVSAASKTTLWNRLSAHRGTASGSQPGGGNHRGSIFRLHVGKALLAREGFDRQAAGSWGVGGSAPKAVREAEYPIERAVSRYICAMPVVWVGIPGEAGVTSDRKLVEANAIALLSNRGRQPIDRPSLGWLGNLSPHPAVRESGLWNVHHVDEYHDPAFLDVLEGYVRSTCS
jgi:hypothetical protein